MAALSHDDLIKALEKRFDYLSARSMAGALLAGAGVDRGDAYDAKAVGQLAEACESVIGSGADRVIAALRGPAPAPAAAAAPAAVEEAPAEAPADKPAKEEATAAAPAKKKPAAKAKKKK